MNLYIGADHAGFALKEKLKKALGQKYKVIDLTPSYDPADDYPDAAVKVASKVSREKAKGILLCGSSEGICIAANKVKGIRAVAAFTEAAAKLSRLHNDANILCLSGGGFKDAKDKRLLPSLPPAKAAKIANVWLATKFSGEARHRRRIEKIAQMER